MLSDSFLSDAVCDGPDASEAPQFGRAHRDGLVRGVAFLGALAALVAAIYGGIRLQAAALDIVQVAHAFAGSV